MNLTHENHLYWSVGGQGYWGRTSDSEKFHFEVGRIKPNPQSWAEELGTAVMHFVIEHGAKPALFYSGGADSELVLRSFMDRRITPEVHIIQFEDDLNAHEVKNAFEVCNELGIKPVVWKHDVMKYVRDEQYLDLGLKYQCSQIAYLTVLEYARKVDKPVIMGGEIYLQKHQHHADGVVHAATDWYYIYREDEDGVTYRYSYDTGHPIINEFFTYTPELLYTWLVHPSIRRIAQNAEPGKITLLSIKRGVYEQEIGYKLHAQTKFHGYEALSWVNLFVQRRMKELLPKSQVCRYEYNQLVSDLCTPVP